MNSKKILNWKNVGIISAVLMMSSSVIISSGSSVIPGSDSDPIVTQSYVDLKIKGLEEKDTKISDSVSEIEKQMVTQEQINVLKAENESLKKQIEDLNGKLNDTSQLDKLAEENQSNSKLIVEMKEQINNLKESPSSGEMPKYAVVKLLKNQKLIGGESSELILRSGKATAIVSKMGGLSDVSYTGKDLKQGESVPLNHLIIIPRADGRGITITSPEAYVLVRGSYEVK